MVKSKALCAIAIALSITSISACNNKNHEAFYIEAKQFIDSGNNSAAIVSLKNAVQDQPNNANYRLLLAKTYLSIGDIPSAEKEVSRAWELGSENDETFGLWVQSLFLQEKFEDVLLISDSYQPQSDLISSDVLLYEAISLVNLEELDKAESLARGFSKLDDVQNNKAIIDATIEASKGNFRLSSKNLSAATNATNAEKLLLQGRLSYILNNYPMAIESFQAYLEAYPKSFRAAIYLTSTYLASKDIDQAELALRSVLTINANHPISDQLQAEVAFSQENFEKSKSFAEAAISKNLKSTRIDFILAISAFKLGYYEVSFNAIEGLPEEYKNNQTIQQVDLLTRIRLGYDLEIKETDLQQFEHSFTEKLSIDLAKNGYFEQAKKVGEAALARNDRSDSPNSRLKRAFLKIGFGNKDEGIEDLLELQQGDSSNQTAAFLLAYAQLRDGKLDDAIETAKKSLDNGNDPTSILPIIAKAYETKSDTINADKYYSQLNELTPEHKAPVIYFADQRLNKGQLREAKELVTEHINKYGSIDKLDALFLEINTELNTHEDNITYFRGLFDSSPNAKSRAFYSQALLEADKFDQAITLLTQNTDNKQTRSYIDYSNLGAAYLGKADYVNALSTYEGWVTSSVTAPNAYVNLINVLDVLQNNKKAYDVSQRAMIKYPSNAEFKVLAAHFSIETDQLTQAESLVRTLSNDKGLQIKSIHGLKGRILFKRGNYSDALPLLKRHYSAFPTRKNIIPLIQTAIKHESNDSAISLLEQLLQNNTKDFIAMQYYADSLLTRNPDKAEQLYETVVESNANQTQSLNNLAWLKYNKGKFNEALPYAQKAIGLSPNSINISSTLGGIYLRLENYNEAAPLLKKAFEAGQDNSLDLYFNYTESLIRTGDSEKATNMLNKLKIDSKLVSERKRTLEKLLKR